MGVAWWGDWTPSGTCRTQEGQGRDSCIWRDSDSCDGVLVRLPIIPFCFKSYRLASPTPLSLDHEMGQNLLMPGPNFLKVAPPHAVCLHREITRPLPAASAFQGTV